jgi:hypothetical protein
MNVGGSRADSGLPPEMVRIIESGWEETEELRQNLIGQFLGILTGGGAYEYQNVGTSGRWEERYVPGGRVVVGYTGGEGGHPIYEDRPPTYERVWVPGNDQMEWVQTGGPNASIPIIKQAEEAQRRATSGALRQTTENLALRNLLGTPFGEQTLATQLQQGATAFAGIEPGIIAKFMEIIPSYTQGNVSSIMGATSGARESDAKSAQFGFGT